MGYISEFEGYSDIATSRSGRTMTVESPDVRHFKYKALAKAAMITIGVAAAAAMIVFALTTLRSRGVHP